MSNACQSRACFSRALSDAAHPQTPFSFVPFLDSLNHAPPDGREAVQSFSDGGFRVTAQRDYAPGEQVTGWSVQVIHLERWMWYVGCAAPQ